MHLSGNLLIFARTHPKRQRALVSVVEAVIASDILTGYNGTVSSAPVGVMLKEHACHLALAMVPFGNTHDDYIYIHTRRRNFWGRKTGSDGVYG